MTVDNNNIMNVYVIVVVVPFGDSWSNAVKEVGFSVSLSTCSGSAGFTRQHLQLRSAENKRNLESGLEWTRNILLGIRTQ